MTLSDRLRTAMLEAGLNQADLARACGVKPPSVSGWLSGKSKFLRGENLLRAAQALGVSDSWLATGKGQKSRSPLALPAPETDRHAVSPPETGTGYVRAEQMGEADMGDGCVNDDYPEVIRSVDFTEPYIRALVGFVPPPGRLKLVTGRGDSMIPTIMPGDVVLVDTGCASFDGDGLYLVNSGNGQQIKILQDRGSALFVVSANRDYPEFQASPELIIGGKVYLRNRLDRMA